MNTQITSGPAKYLYTTEEHVRQYDELRAAITTRDFNGNVQLKPEIYGAVGVIDGQDLSDKNLRLAHARLIQWRNDKSAQQCTIRKDFLERLIL